MGFVLKSVYFTIWAKTILSKYIGVWLLAEGAVILSGNIVYLNRVIDCLSNTQSTCKRSLKHKTKGISKIVIYIQFAGLGYNGRKDNGTILWNGCANVRLHLFESCSSFGEVKFQPRNKYSGTCRWVNVSPKIQNYSSTNLPINLYIIKTSQCQQSKF